MSNYGIEDIESLSFKDGVRERIPMYLGTDDTEGIYQALKEVINNSTDEALMGFGNRIIIVVNEATGFVSVEDEGRGIPFGIRDNGENVLVSIFSKSHTGGKFNNKNYTTVSGLNGIGIKATCLSSDEFYATSYRDNSKASVVFKKGELISYKEESSNHKNGTYVKFRPDPAVFKNMSSGFTYNKICENIKIISYLTKGVNFIVKNEISKEEKTYCSDNGIADFIKDNVTKPLMRAPIICSAKDDTDEVEVAFMWTGGAETSYVFVNGLICEQGGSPVTGAKTTITTSIKRLSGKDFDPELIRKGLVYAINCKVANPSFANQTKSKINNPNLRTLASQAFKQGLEEFSHTPEFKTIIDMLTKIQRAEKAADKAREAILNQNKDVERENKKKSVMANKLKDCRIHDEKSILYITEGDSALGSFTASRDSTYVAAMPIRGKIINALKNPIEKVLENEEVKDIAKACGCGILDKVKLNNLRYGKIAFAADADPDGYAIVCLLLVLFYVLMPELIKEGKVYWAQFPLYEVTLNNKLIFAYDDEELAQIISKNPNAKYVRNKGLGEMDSDAFAEAAFGENARLIQFTMEDAEEAVYMLELLLGKKNEERSEYIFSNVDFSVIEGE